MLILSYGHLDICTATIYNEKSSMKNQKRLLITFATLILLSLILEISASKKTKDLPERFRKWLEEALIIW